MLVSATNHSTGELIELPVDNFKQLVQAWRIAQDYDKTATRLKDQLKSIVPQYVEKDRSPEYDNAQFKITSIQRMTYDKATLREVVDEDTFDVLTKPDKPAIDKYLKENLEELGDASTRLRQAMVPEGKPYEVIKLEKLSRE